MTFITIQYITNELESNSHGNYIKPYEYATYICLSHAKQFHRSGKYLHKLEKDERRIDNNEQLRRNLRKGIMKLYVNELERVEDIIKKRIGNE